MARTNRGSRNNNPSGRNQYSWSVMEMARERPVAAAAAAAGAAAAGLFLWSKRAAISDQLTNLSDQIGEWTDSMRSDSGTFSDSDDTGGVTSNTSSPARNQRGLSETGGGNASLGRSSGGGGIRANASSRGRAKGIPSTT